MASQGKNWIDTSPISDKFRQELSVKENNRIIFSGIFGIGKTTFLRNYFKKDNNSIALHLFPVNYSVASNKDIFELIKYDILYQILLHKPDLEALDVSKMDIISYLDWDNVYEIVKPFIKAIPTLGKSVTNILEATENMLNALESKRIKLTIDEPKLLSDFISNLENKVGGIYENDLYTGLINSLISQLKTKEGKEVVLVIDDLDRIDPEHIFRILNVFAAHFDSDEYRNSDNKFGVDKVILSCDVNNIRNIFHHKYGAKVDFNGYVNKFCSRKVFDFDIRTGIADSLNEILFTIENDLIRYPQYSINFQVGFLLSSLSNSSTINLRSLLKYELKSFEFSSYSLRFSSGFINSSELVLFHTFDFVVSVLGGLESTLQAFKSSIFEFNRRNKTAWNSLIGELVFIADHQTNQLRDGSHAYHLSNHEIEYQATKTDSGMIGIKINSVDGKQLTDETFRGEQLVININELIITAFELYIKYRRITYR